MGWLMRRCRWRVCAVGPYLMRYVGHCAEGGRRYLLAERARFGSLSSLLNGEVYADRVSLCHMVTMLVQIVRGMEALVGARIVHRDLAARNVLVYEFDVNDARKTRVKVSDYGLAIDLASQSYVREGQSSRAPLLHMAPEAITHGRYSEKSDVWAFGVTAYEVLSGGAVPYAPHYRLRESEAAADVCGGTLRLSCPRGCPDWVWAVIAPCFETLPRARPTFVRLREQLDGVLDRACGVRRARVGVSRRRGGVTGRGRVSVGASLSAIRVASGTAGMSQVVGAMVRHPHNVYVQELGCRTLAEMFDRERNGARVVASGGVGAVLRAMSHHMGITSIQSDGCAVLGNLCHPSFGGVTCAAVVVCAGGVTAILAALTGHRGNEHLQYVGISALGHIAWYDKLVSIFASYDCVELVLSSMRCHRMDSNVPRACCILIARLARAGLTRCIEKILANNGVSAIVTAMHEHEKDAAVQRPAIAALADLSLHEDHAVMATLGCIGETMDAMRRHPDDAVLLSNAAVTLIRIGHDEGDVRAMMLQLGVLDVMQMVLPRHRRDERLNRVLRGLAEMLQR